MNKGVSIVTKKRSLSTIIATILLAFASVIFIYPLFYLLFYSLKSNVEIFGANPFGLPNEWLFSNYTRAFEAFDIVGYFGNSVFVSLISLTGILCLALPFAYAVTRLRWKLKTAATTYLMLGLFIPVQAIIIPLSILIRDLHLAGTHFTLIVPYIAFNLGFAIMVTSIGFMEVPHEMEEAAFIDGASIFKCFFKIILPMIKPSIATAIIFAFLNVWNEYTVATILVHQQELKTLPIGLSSFVGEYSTEWGPMGATLVVASIPTIVVYLLLSENVEKALAIGGGVKG